MCVCVCVCVCMCMCVCAYVWRLEGGNERVVTHHNQEDGSGNKLKVEADANQSSLHHDDNNGDKDQPTCNSSCVGD